MAIQNIIVHEVHNDEEQDEAQLNTRDNENPINEHAEKLSTELSKLFRKTGLSTGEFTIPEHEDDQPPHFVTLLERYFDNNHFLDFVTFSKSATRYFKEKLDDEHASKGGYLWFNHYTHNNEHFLSIVLLRKKYGISLSNGLDLGNIEQLDIDKLHMAARINLSSWINSASHKYIAFRIGRSAQNVTDYFSKFIGCEQYTRARVDTQALVEATKDYCSHHGFNDMETQEAKELIFEQCVSQLEAGEPVFLDNLSTLLDAKYIPEEEAQFLVIAQDEPYELNNELVVERSALRGLTRYSVRTKKFSMRFDSDLLNVSVIYNRNEGTILLTDPPQQLKDQLDA